MTVAELYTLKETIASEIFEGVTYPWEVLPKIGAFIVELGSTLPKEEYEKIGEDVWVAKSAKVAATASIHGPAIIGKEAEIRHCAFIPRKCYRGRRSCCRKFYRVKKCNLI